MEILKRFYEDVHTREAFKEFQTNLLKELAIDVIFNKKDVSGFHEANNLVVKSFERLEELYKPKTISDKENEAR